MMRTRRWLVGAALVAALAIGALVLGIDWIARRAVETGAERATGVDAGVLLVHVGILRPSFRVRGLRLANPEGFRADDFLRMRSLYMRLPTRNLLADEIRVPELVIEGLELELERDAKRTNYGVILENLERGVETQPASAPAEGGRTLIIERVVVRDSRAHLRASPLPPLDVHLPEIVLRDVGSKGTGSQNAEAVVRAVLAGVLRAVARDTPGIPREVARELAGGLAELAAEQGARGVKEFGRAAGEAARKAAEGLGRIFERGD